VTGPGRVPIILLLLAGLASACGSIAPTPTASSGARTQSPLASSSPSAPPVPCQDAPPPVRSNPAATQDLARNETLMFGGDLPNGTSVAETWLFDGHCWKQAAPSLSPPARQSAALVYDPDVRKSLLVGGRKDNPKGRQTIPGDVWTWDGQSWSLVVNAPHFGDAIAAYDADRHQVVVFGAALQGVGTWTWDGVHWSLLSGPAPERFYPSSAAMCFDRSNHSFVLFGGQGDGAPPINNDTWLWDRGWVQQNPAHAPPPRFGAALMCGDHALLFGGIGGQLGPALVDTWQWDGADWQQLHPLHGPGAKYLMFGVFDGERALLFIGTTPDQIWTWTGTDWSLVT